MQNAIKGPRNVWNVPEFTHSLSYRKDAVQSSRSSGCTCAKKQQKNTWLRDKARKVRVTCAGSVGDLVVRAELLPAPGEP